MNYQDYNIKDFINDQAFVCWVKEPTASSDRFWTEFLKNNPDKADAVEEARAFVMRMNFKENPPDDAAIIKMKSSIDLALLDQTQEPATRKVWPKRWFQIAAALLILLSSGGIFFWFFKNNAAHPVDKAFASDENQIIKTAKGKRTIVTLEDGTRVWLNADSKIAYDKHFREGNVREVFLDGEAFFDVAENKARPFIVNTSSISVKVLGTEFNVRSFKTDSTVEATLVRGKISLSTGVDQEEILLLPNQQAVYVKESRQVVLQNKVDTQDYTSWKHGQLNFNDETFETIMHDIERWYDVKIIIKNTNDRACRFSAKIDNKTLEEVLELFKAAGPSFNYRIEGKQVFITGNFCDDNL